MNFAGEEKIGYFELSPLKPVGPLKTDNKINS